MADHTSTATFVRALQQWPRKVEQGQRAAVNAAALHVSTHVRAAVLPASGGDNRLSGVGKKGAKVGVRYNVRNAKDPTALVSAQGPLHLIERDTKAGPRHWKTRRSRRLSGGRAGPRQAMGHPGTQGKHPFAKGVAVALPSVGRVMHKAFRAGWGIR